MTDPSISIASLWRYPVKGLNGETLTDVELRPAAPFPGDRAYAIEFRPTDYDPAAPSFVKKSYFYQLALFPELARISCRFDAGETLELRLDERPLARFSLEDPAAPGNFQKALIALLGQSPAHPPKLIGGGPGRFTDQSRPLVSIINLASVAATGEALGTMLDPVRFRGNIYLARLAGDRVDRPHLEARRNRRSKSCRTDHPLRGNGSRSEKRASGPAGCRHTA